MVVFKYKYTKTPEQCHMVIQNMNLPGEPINEELDSNSTLVWKGEKFIGILYPDEERMELYGTKNTNSINFYIMKYGSIDWDTFSIVKSKRW